MLKEIASHQYLEYGKHEGHVYGTKLSAVQDLMVNGRVPVLDVETPVSLHSLQHYNTKGYLSPHTRQFNVHSTSSQRYGRCLDVEIMWRASGKA